MGEPVAEHAKGDAGVCRRGPVREHAAIPFDSRRDRFVPPSDMLLPTLGGSDSICIRDTRAWDV